MYDKTTLLEEGIDYTILYKNNLKAYDLGEGEKNADTTFDPNKAPQVIIKMKGNYKDNKTVYFKILPQNISISGNCIVDDISVVKNGKVQTPKPALIWNGKTLKYGTDYTCTIDFEKCMWNGVVNSKALKELGQ